MHLSSCRCRRCRWLAALPRCCPVPSTLLHRPPCEGNRAPDACDVTCRRPRQAQLDRSGSRQYFNLELRLTRWASDMGSLGTERFGRRAEQMGGVLAPPQGLSRARPPRPQSLRRDRSRLPARPLHRLRRGQGPKLDRGGAPGPRAIASSSASPRPRPSISRSTRASPASTAASTSSPSTGSACPATSPTSGAAPATDSLSWTGTCSALSSICHVATVSRRRRWRTLDQGR
jgi:hypothetical protein